MILQSSGDLKKQRCGDMESYLTKLRQGTMRGNTFHLKCVGTIQHRIFFVVSGGKLIEIVGDSQTRLPPLVIAKQSTGVYLPIHLQDITIWSAHKDMFTVEGLRFLGVMNNPYRVPYNTPSPTKTSAQPPTTSLSPLSNKLEELSKTQKTKGYSI